MMEDTAQPVPARPNPRRGLSALVVLFVLSGCSALIYEVVWFQLLQLVIGSSAISLGILLGTFMGGLCLGSLAMPMFVSRRPHPLCVYAFMELGIGAMGLLLLYGMPLAQGIYAAWGGPGTFGIALRGIVAGICLLPPTFLMGATLPAISRWVETTPKGASWLGLFYGGNIAGAVIGSLAAGFYLLRFYDVSTATYAAVALNIGVALLSISLAKSIPYEPAPDSEPLGTQEASESALRANASAWAVYVAIALSGMTALASEVVWTRLLSLLFGATVYAFALILAVFLLGLGIGASAGAAIGGKVARPRAALGWCQLLLCGAMVWTAYQLVSGLPYWILPKASDLDPWVRMRFDLARCCWAVLPPAILWGASFPLALAALAGGKQDSGQKTAGDPGRWVGGVYGANTVGTIIGSLAASLWLVSWIGSHHTEQVLIAASAISGILALAPVGEARSKAAFATAIVVGMIGGGFAVRTVPDTPRNLIAYGRQAGEKGRDPVIYAAEGLTSSVAITRTSEGALNYHNAGKIQASSEYQDMRLQRMLGHLTTLAPSNPRRFLVIGLGAGVTAGAVSIEPELEQETIAEIEPLVPKTVSEYFKDYNFDVVNSPKVHIEVDDGRHFLQTTKETFDGITSDPLDPWVKGTAALYSKEFFALAKSRLNPGGVMTLFVQLYESNEEAVKSEIATFFEVFPQGSVFANTVMGQGYDVVLLGQATPGPIDADRMQARLKTPEYARMAKSLEEIGFYSAADLLSTYVGQATDLRPWLQGALITRDSNLRLQYLAGMSMNTHDETAIYEHMTAFGPHLTPGAFTGSAELLQYLGQAIESGSSRY